MRTSQEIIKRLQVLKGNYKKYQSNYDKVKETYETFQSTKIEIGEYTELEDETISHISMYQNEMQETKRMIDLLEWVIN